MWSPRSSCFHSLERAKNRKQQPAELLYAYSDLEFAVSVLLISFSFRIDPLSMEHQHSAGVGVRDV